MSAENDDLFSQSGGALLFADLSDNGDDLDFTKDFFSDTLHHAHDLNGSCYESMGGDDLIAELEGQDVFSRLGASELNSVSSFGADIEQKSSLDLSPPAHSKPFPNGQILASYGNFQKPSINVHMNTGFPVSDMFMQRNGMTNLVSPTSPALKSSGLLSPGATSEKLNCLSLDQRGYPSYRQSSYDVKSNRAFSKGSSYSPAGVMPHSPGEKRFASSPLSSPTVQSSPHANSNGIPSYGSTSGQDMVDSVISSPDGMQSPSSHSGLASDGATLCSNSGDTKDDVDGMLVGDSGLKIQQGKPLFMSTSSLSHRLGAAVDSNGFVAEIDANGDGLRPLPSPMQHSSRPPLMQRSYSSHALGGLRTIAPAPQNIDQVVSYTRIASSETPSRLGNSNSSPHLQPHVADMQGIHLRPLMHSMRRVHSTGDIQTLNGMQLGAGGSSPSALDRSNYEEGGFKIGRYTVEERKIRIHRYQQKRTQRNFNKKIKYACRKTLADSRPRVRGRFAKNDEVGEPLTKQNGKHEDEDEEEGEMLHLDEEEEVFGDEDSSGDLSDMLTRNGVKLEHPSPKGIKIEHHSMTSRTKILQT